MGSRHVGTSQEKLALTTFICLMGACESVSKRVHQHLVPRKLTISQFGVLEALLHLGPLTQKEIGQKMLRSSGNMTLVIDNLEKQSLVSREPVDDDRRYNQIVLTTAGRRVIEEIFPEHARHVLNAFSELKDSEQELLKGLCKKLGKSNVKS